MIFSFASHDPSQRPLSGDIDPVRDEELAGERGEVREEINKALTDLMPWGVSILVHVALIVLAFVLVWQTITPGEEPATVPQLGLSEAPPAPMELTELAESLDGGPVVQPDIKPVDPETPTVTGFGEVVRLPQIVPSTGIRGPIDGPGTGVGDRPTIIDVTPGGNSTKFVFIIDASGSMVDVLPFVVNELKRMVDGLKPKYEVTFLFFSGEGIFEAPVGGRKTGLRPVDAGFKRDFNEWVALDNHRYKPGGRGSAYVRQTLERALSYKPQEVFLLSDNLTGGGQGATQHELFQDDLVDLIHEMNKSTPPARIHTIQFLYEDPLVRAGLEGTLQRISRETGGMYAFKSYQDLKLR